MLSSMFRPNEFSSLKEDFDENSFVFDATTSSTPPQQLQRDEFVDASEEMLDAVTAPEKGLGVKERDKILDDLKKENFNLKLRIFFLEERLESFCVDGDGKKSKENIILKFQAEIEELELDLMDERNNCKKAMDDCATSNALNKQLEFEIEQLRTEAREFKSIADDAKAVDLELQSIATSESNSKLGESNLPKQKGVAAVKSRIVDLISNNKTLESKTNELSAENSQLRENLNKTVESLKVSSQDLSAAQKECAELRKKLSTAIEDVHELKGSKLGLEAALKETTQAHERTLSKLESNARDIEGLKMKLKSRDNDDLITADLKTEILQLKQSLEEKSQQENALQVTIHNLSIDLADSKDRIHKMQQQAGEHSERMKNLQHQLMESTKQINNLQAGHFEKQNQHEKEISDLHDHFSKLAQEKAHELEQMIQARNKAKSPGIEIMKLRAQHSTELDLYRQQISDFERLSEIAATEMTLLKHELETQTRKLCEIEERWRAEKNAREAASARDTEATERALRECEERWRRCLEDERRFMKEGERELNERVSGYQVEVAGLSGEVGRLKGELEARVSMHQEAQRRFTEENERISEEGRALEKELEQVVKDREELFQMVQRLQQEREEWGSHENDHVESFRDVLSWINTVLGLPEMDLNQVKDVYILKQRIRSSLEDFQKIREYFIDSLRAVEDAFQIESAQYAVKFTAILDRLKRFEEIIKKATQLQKKLKTQLELSNQELAETQTAQSTHAQELEGLRNQVFVIKNEHLCTQAELEDLRLELDKREEQVQEARRDIDRYKKEIHGIEMDLEKVKSELENEKEYCEQVVQQFKKLEQVESETRQRLKEAEEDLTEAAAREALYKDKIRFGESLNHECQTLEHEIAEIQKQRHNERKVLDEKLRNLEEELNMTKRQLEISEKHVQNLKESKVMSPITPIVDDPASLVSANDRLRSDYFHSRRVIEEKENSLQELRNQFTDVIHRLENSRLKHIGREEKYRKTIAKAIEHLERFNGRQEGMESALDILREKVAVSTSCK